MNVHTDCVHKTGATLEPLGDKTIFIFSRVRFPHEGSFWIISLISYPLKQSTLGMCSTCLGKNLATISSTRFWKLLKAPMTPDGILNAVALHSLAPESFFNFPVCVLIVFPALAFLAHCYFGCFQCDWLWPSAGSASQLYTSSNSLEMYTEWKACDWEAGGLSHP